jgi:hypothetical protein
MPRSRTLLAALAIALVSLLAVPAADAKLVSKEHYAFTESHIEQEEHGADFCPNVPFPVLFEGDTRGTLLVKTKGSGPFPYFADRFQDTAVFTNTENGKSLTQKSVSRFADQTIVDNGDGTITITVKGTGRNHVFGPDGTRLFVDSGQFQFDILIDYNGTPDNPDDDTFLADLGVHKDVGRVDTAGRDFCEDLVIFLS